ncbi:acyl carrier protein [Nostoc sp. C117]|uniref:acyl carrier protein n=1 Tax=Nostoc sp. C117 TaxID=3349875 RepID=UPI00370D303C
MNTQTKKNTQEIQEWIISWLSKELKIEADELDIEEPFVNFNLSSRQTIILTGDLEDWLGFSIEPSVAWEYPTINKLAEFLAAKN